MATAPPPPAPQPPPSGGGTNKILLGCGIGCGVLLLLALILGGVFWVKVFKPIAETTQKIETIKKQNQASIDAIAALDSSYPSSVGEDLDTVDLLPSQLDGYIKARTALGPQAAAVAEARDGVAGALDMGGLAGGGMGALKAGMGMMGNMMRGMLHQEEVRGELLKAAVDELDAVAMGPTELSRILEMVEWRFLQDEAALPVALSESERSDWLAKQWQQGLSRSILDGAGAQMGASDRAEMERQIEQAEERLDDLRALAAERTTLSAATRRLLETRRAELQSLPAAGVMELGMLSENPDPMEALQGFGGMGP